MPAFLVHVPAMMMRNVVLWVASTWMLSGCVDMQPVLAREGAPALGLALIVVSCWFSGRERRGRT